MWYCSVLNEVATLTSVDHHWELDTYVYKSGKSEKLHQTEAGPQSSTTTQMYCLSFNGQLLDCRPRPHTLHHFMASSKKTNQCSIWMWATWYQKEHPLSYGAMLVRNVLLYTVWIYLESECCRIVWTFSVCSCFCIKWLWLVLNLSVSK